MLKRRIFFEGLSLCCGGPHGEVKGSQENHHDHKTPHDSTGLCAAETCAQIDRKLEYPPIAIV